jgi:hypothetical protein
LSIAVTPPNNAPLFVGVTDNVKVHFAFAARTKPLVQGFVPDGVTPNSPSVLKFASVSEEPLTFCIDTEMFFVVPTTVEPRFAAEGENVSGFVPAPPVALPVKFTDWGL